MKHYLEEDIEIIRNSDFFDSEWYLEQYPDIKKLGIDPAEHYLWLGARLNRNPSLKFNTYSYLKANTDVAKSRLNPLLHYEKHGREEGRPLALDIIRKNNYQEKNNLNTNLERYTGNDLVKVNSAAKNYSADSKEPERETHIIQFAKKIIGGITSDFSKQYEIVKKEFDLSFYLYRYPDIANAVNVDPIKHYIEHGASEGRDPSPEFMTNYYLKRYPDVKENGVNPFYHWLAIGRAEGRRAIPFSAGDTTFEAMCEIQGFNSYELERDLSIRRRDLRMRFERGVLGEMVSKAAELEPLIAHSWREVFTAKFPPFHSEELISQVVAMHLLHKAARFRRAKVVVVIPHCRISGASRVAGFLTTALSELYNSDEIVIIRTDLDVMQFPEWFPDDCRHINFANTVKKLNLQNRQKLLMEFLRSLRPKAVFNVNSKLFWDMIAVYGKILSDDIDLYTYFFCNDRNIYGHWSGYPIQKFSRYFDIFNTIITDSHVLADELRERFIVPPVQSNKVITLKTAINKIPSLVPAPENSFSRRPQIYWAGRFDRQKRVDIVYALAERIPEAEFHLWGEPVLDNHASKLKKPDNIILKGLYKDFSEIPLEYCDLWLYTSEWDGVPNILIDIAAAGVPLVGSLVGGTSEILLEGLSQRVIDIENIDSYEASIRSILNNPEIARERAARLRDYVIGERSLASYSETLRSILLRDIGK